QHLNLGGQPGDLLHLGGFHDIVSGHDLKRELGFGLSIGFRSSASRHRSIEYDVSYCHTPAGTPMVKSLTYVAGDRTFLVERGQKGGYLLTTKDAGAPLQQPKEFPSKRVHEPERSIAFSAAAVAALGLDGDKVQDLALRMVEALKGIVYLGP